MVKRLVAALAAIAVLLAVLRWCAWPDAPAPVAGPGDRATAGNAAPEQGPAGGDRPGGAATTAARAGAAAATIVLQGRVVDGAGTALADVAVHALIDPPLSPQALLRQQQRGERSRALA